MALNVGFTPEIFQTVNNCCWLNVDSSEFKESSPGIFHWSTGSDEGESVFRWLDSSGNVIGGPETCIDTSLDVVKSADVLNISDALPGDTITYTVVVTNTGSATIFGVSVNDPIIQLSGPTTDLISGDSATFSGTYVVTQDDIDAGQIINTAVADGVDPDGLPVVCDSNEYVVGLGEGLLNPSLSVEKFADESLLSESPQVGDCIIYNVTVTNDGDADLTGVCIDDPLCDIARLDVPYTGLVRDSGLPTSSNGASSFHLFLPESDTVFAEEVCATINIGADPDDNFLRFWALEVDFADTAGGLFGAAHMGLQWIDGFPDSNAVNWGGFDANGVLLTGPGFLAGGPNTFEYDWTPNTDYKYRVYYVSPGVARAEITDLSTGVVTPIRDLNVGNNATLFRAPRVWGEIFAPCDDLEPLCWEWTDWNWTLNGVNDTPGSVFANYQSHADGGCTNQSTIETADGAMQCTNSIVANHNSFIIWGGDNKVDLFPGASQDFICKYFLTQSDIDAQEVINVVTATGDSAAGSVSDTDSTTVDTSPFVGNSLCPDIPTTISDWEGCVDDTIDIAFNPPADSPETLELLGSDGNWTSVSDPTGDPADCCIHNNATVRVVCEGVPGSEADLTVWPNKFSTEGSKILDPCGNEFFGAGMNVAFSTTNFPFVFEGIHGGGGDCNGAVDIWPGNNNVQGGTQCYPGGGINSYDTKFSPQAGSTVSLPDRYYAVNGYLSAAAQAAGITAPADDWSQNLIRVTTLPEGGGSNPTISDQIPHVIAGMYEALQAGIVVMTESHNVTGDNISPGVSFDSPASAIANNDLRLAVEFQDQLFEEFKIDGVCDASHVGSNFEQGYVWFNPVNEPWTSSDSGADGCVSQAYLDAQTWWIERIRNFHGAENIIVLDLGNFAQDLAGLAAGCYDDWWDDLKNHPSGDLTRSVVLSWHNYGADTIRGGQMTYANMDADLNTVLNVKQFPLHIGEYGQTANPTFPSNPAGPNAWNRSGFEHLMTNNNGPALALKYNVHPTVWHATGDGTFNKLYKLAQGPAPASTDPFGTPFWDIESGSDPLLEPLGEAHWEISHINDDKNTICVNNMVVGPPECVIEPSLEGPQTFTFGVGEIMDLGVTCSECPPAIVTRVWQQRAANGFYGAPSLPVPDGIAATSVYDGTCWRVGCFDNDGNGSWSDPDIGASACFTINIEGTASNTYVNQSIQAEEGINPVLEVCFPSSSPEQIWEIRIDDPLTGDATDEWQNIPGLDPGADCVFIEVLEEWLDGLDPNGLAPNGQPFGFYLRTSLDGVNFEPEIRTDIQT